jgi:hypothetical protein
MERTFALIKGSVVTNSIVADDKFIDYIRDEYDHIIETTDFEVKPGIHFFYNEDGTFTAPPTEETPIDVEALEEPAND